MPLQKVHGKWARKSLRHGGKKKPLKYKGELNKNVSFESDYVVASSTTLHFRFNLIRRPD